MSDDRASKRGWLVAAAVVAMLFALGLWWMADSRVPAQAERAASPRVEVPREPPADAVRVPARRDPPPRPVDEGPTDGLKALADALDGYTIRCQLPPHHNVQAFVTAPLSENAPDRPHLVWFVAAKPVGRTHTNAPAPLERLMVTWEGDEDDEVIDCRLEDPYTVEVQLELKWLDDGSPAEGVVVRQFDKGTNRDLPGEGATVRLTARQFEVVNLFPELPAEPVRTTLFVQDSGGVYELLVDAPPEQPRMTVPVYLHRPSPDGLTRDHREAMEASLDTVLDLFPPDTTYDEPDIDQGLATALEQAQGAGRGWLEALAAQRTAAEAHETN